MAARRPPARVPDRPRARRSAAKAWRLPTLDQHQRDLFGLGLVAVAVLLAVPLYLGADGGSLGGGALEGLRRAFGLLAYLVPVVLGAVGGLVVLQPMMPSVRPVRAGALLVGVAVALGTSAGTFGVGPGDRPGWWNLDEYRETGGLVGEALFWATSTALGTVGAHVLAIFLLIGGVLVLTGATVAGLAQRTQTAARDTTRVLRAAVPARTRLPAEPDDDADGDADDTSPLPEARSDLVDVAQALDDDSVTLPIDDEWDLPDSTVIGSPAAEDVEPMVHAQRPSLDGAERFPDLFESDGPVARLPVPGDPEAQAFLPVEDMPDRAVADADEAEASFDDSPDPAMELPHDDADDLAVIDPAALTPRGRLRSAVTDDPAFIWKVPSARRLTRSTREQVRPDTAGQKQTALALIEALAHFKVDAKLVGTVAGPHITRYELRLAPGIKMSKVAQLKDDLAYALAAVDIRILAPIPGKTAVGIEVPNLNRRMVHLGDVFSPRPDGAGSPLTVWLGKDVAGHPVGADLAKMPHLLVAGTTGAGKSGAINAMLSSLLLSATPHELRMVLVDPKQVELNHYESIPHLLTPVITNPRKAANALQNLVKEMEARYTIMSLARTRSLNELNRTREQRGEQALPYILCVIDELADLMMVAPADVEDSIIRLAQKARAVGIHLVLATQSPRVDVITGMIKANVPSRIAFAVSSQTDSRVILDQNGAESLLGQGDMLFAPVGTSRLQRIQGAYIDEGQIEQITAFWRAQGEPELREELLDEVADSSADDATAAGDGEMSPDEDPLLEDAIRLVAEMGTASTSMLQRRLRLGYTRAGRLIDMLERRNVISGYEGSKPRQVLVAGGDIERFLATLRAREGRVVNETAPPTDVHEAVPVGE